MNIKQVKSNFGDNVYYMKLSKVKGKNLLLKNGWKLCSNPNYLTNGVNTGHYNTYYYDCYNRNGNITGYILV